MKDSNELFELCKQVYEVTKWDDVESYINESEDYVNPSSDVIDPVIHTPLYTSDYLLEKLPRTQEMFGNTTYLTVQGVNIDQWCASYDHIEGQSFKGQFADTPLKSLLKLTLKLHEE